ncbi:MAG TPA: MFS transporter [Solirubrobacteraceae bacterium]|nr:MFS transporter [Solirubrobacteraceae bacterium]
MSTQELTYEAVPAPARVGARVQEKSRWLPLPVVLAGTFMVVLDYFIVNVALPSIQSQLRASDGALEWVVAGFACTSAIFVITAGRLGDRFGRRRMFSLGLTLFTLASAACGAAGTPLELVIARLVQGAAAALVMPNVLSIISVLYAGPDRLRALSVYGTVMGLAAVSGQLIGGALIAADPAGLGWRSCFLINVPVGIAALLLAPRVIPESRQSDSSRLDKVGTALATLALIAVVLPLLEGRQHGWPAWTWLSLAAAPVLLTGFVAHQRRLTRAGAGPLLDMALFRERSFSAGLLTQLCFWAGQGSFFVVLALYLQSGRGMKPLAAGLVFTILAGAYVATSMRAPMLTARFGRVTIALGAVMLAAGHGLLLGAVVVVGVGGSVGALVPGLLLVGAGMGLVLAPLASTVLQSLAPERAGSASGMMATVQNVGNALGVAITGVIFFGALHSGYATAFELAVGELAVLLIGVAALTRLLPKQSRRRP